MKINEKNLAYFAVSDTPVDKEGYLLKRGEMNKSFQKRWFVLKGNLLFYFERKTDKEPVGVIILEGCTIELAENEDQFTFKMVFHGAGGRTYVFGAESQELMEEWMKVLACASYDYMKLMVAELQRQLDELSSAEAASSISTKPTNNSNANKPNIRVNPFDNCVQISRETKPVRQAPPPPVVVDPSLIPNPLLCQMETQQTENSESVLPIRKSFRELHEEYGRKIKQQQTLIKRKTKL